MGQSDREGIQKEPAQRIGRSAGQTGPVEQRERSETQPPLGHANYRSSINEKSTDPAGQRREKGHERGDD